MFSIKDYRPPSKQQLRSFGLVLMAGFGVIGLLPTVFRHSSPRAWSLVLSIVFGAAGLLAPAVLRHPHRVWMAIGTILGWINSRIILGIFFYLMITPARLILKLAGHDPLSRSFDRNQETYRVLRRARPAAHMDHQF